MNPTQVMLGVGALLNNPSLSKFTKAAQLPYFNMAMDELQEAMQLNDIPLIHETSAVISAPAGTTVVGLNTVVQLPPNMIELKMVWESPHGQSLWTLVTKKNFLPEYLDNNVPISQFLIYSWQSGEIRLLPANQDNDLKLDYIGRIFQTPYVIGQINVNFPPKFESTKMFLTYKTAAFCAAFIGENETRAIALNQLADEALGRALGIAVKGQQAIRTRRRPFRLAYKNRGLINT